MRSGRADVIAVVDAADEQWTAGGQVSRTMARSIMASPASAGRTLLFVSRRAQQSDDDLAHRGIEIVDLAARGDVSRTGSRRWAASSSDIDRKARRALSLPDSSDPLAYLRRRKPDAVLPLMSAPFRPRLAGSVGWIADFQHRAMPEFFSASEASLRDRTYERLAERCRVVLLSSDAMAQVFRSIYPANSHKARVLSFPSALTFVAEAADAGAVASLYNLPERYVLVANQFWQHKNHDIVVDAVAAARDAGVAIPVVMSGMPADYRDPANRTVSNLLQRIAKAGLSGQVIVLGQVPYDHLVALLRCAAVVLQPSRYEGWSTSVEDAKALAIPLVCSDIAVHREQAADFDASFFNCNDPGSLADVLQSVWASASRPSQAARDVALRQALNRAEVYGAGLIDACDAAVASG
jgi:glycosyltransferase involved in cell wall biosynthesis